MAVIRKKEIKGMQDKEKEEKINELKLELTKKYAPSNKSGKVKAKEIKKAIARLLTLRKTNK